MDTLNDKAQMGAEPLADLQACNKVVGIKQLKKAIRDGRATKVFLAKDADPALTEPLAATCAAAAIPCVWVASMAKLGRACGIEIGAAAAATLQN